MVVGVFLSLKQALCPMYLGFVILPIGFSYFNEEHALECASLDVAMHNVNFSVVVSFLGPVEHVQLLAPFVVIRNKEVNITAVVLPSHSRTVTYFWWLGNNTEVILPGRGSLIHISVFQFLLHAAVCWLLSV